MYFALKTARRIGAAATKNESQHQSGQVALIQGNGEQSRAGEQKRPPPQTECYSSPLRNALNLVGLVLKFCSWSPKFTAHRFAQTIDHLLANEYFFF